MPLVYGLRIAVSRNNGAEHPDPMLGRAFARELTPVSFSIRMALVTSGRPGLPRRLGLGGAVGQPTKGIGLDGSASMVTAAVTGPLPDLRFILEGARL